MKLLEENFDIHCLNMVFIFYFYVGVKSGDLITKIWPNLPYLKFPFFNQKNHLNVGIAYTLLLKFERRLSYIETWSEINLVPIYRNDQQKFIPKTVVIRDMKKQEKILFDVPQFARCWLWIILFTWIVESLVWCEPSIMLLYLLALNITQNLSGKLGKFFWTSSYSLF